MSTSVAPLPPYPSTKARSSLSPSQSAALNQTIASTLAQVLGLPPAQRDTDATRTFVSSYAKDVAQQLLQSLIWEEEDGRSKVFSSLSQVEKTSRQRVFLLSEKLAASGLLDVQTLLDLSVAYSATNAARLRSLFQTAVSNNSSSLVSQVENEAIPALVALMDSPSVGLYGIRKMAHILLCLLRPASPELLRPIARNKAFLVALAKVYDQGMTTISLSYGGIRLSTEVLGRPLDHWERLFLETKVALIDSFHILVGLLLKDISAVSAAGPALAAQCEPAFDVIFALLDLRPHRLNVPPMPFLNQTLLADYRHAYDLSHTLSDVLKRADDARTQLLEARLRELDFSSSDGGESGPGALKLLLRSSGVPPGIDRRGKGPSKASAADAKGKGKAAAAPAPAAVEDPALDLAVSQVLDILPDQSLEYLRFLLSHSDYPYRGNAERLIEALLEGTAPPLAEVEAAMASVGVGLGDVGHAVPAPGASGEEFAYTKERINVWDEQDMKLDNVRVGKKTDDAEALLQDRSFIEQMKADILRRAELESDEEEEEAAQRRGRDLAFEDELEDVEAPTRVRDGPSEDDDERDLTDGEPADEEDEKPMLPETVLELAYIHDPKLFDRDAQTRRGKERADLKAQTGWSDEQIEGWKIMLERNPKKDKILAKHEFSGNRPGIAVVAGPSHAQSGGDRGGRGRGLGGPRGRGRGRGGGRGGGPSGGGEGGDGGSARDRAWKDKNKASHANHDRKRGRDKKMARAGGPS